MHVFRITIHFYLGSDTNLQKQINFLDVETARKYQYLIDILGNTEQTFINRGWKHKKVTCTLVLKYA